MKGLSGRISWLAAIAAAGWGALGLRGVQRTTTSTRLGRSLVSRKHRSTNKFTPHNGARECARRMRQAAKVAA